MSYRHHDYILFGGDYNPDQWDDETIRQDMIYFREADINTVVLPVFSWTKLEPAEGEYHFAWLDHILDILDENKIHYILATPTSAQPAWMSRKYPDMLPVDLEGRRRTHGMRVFFCVNNRHYLEAAAGMARQMAQRYRGRKGLSGWHVANEYGTSCYCETCQQKFREWLKQRYGTVEGLNEHWHTEFWNRTYTSFDEVCLPTMLNDDCQYNPPAELDYQRFKTDSTIRCFHNEADILKEATPDLPVFTNISGYIRKLDQFRMVPEMDAAGWDNYPSPRDPASLIAMKHDLMRAAHDGDSYYVTEQSPAQQNWQPVNKLKKPGEIRRIAWQGIAHGSDASLYFQMRQSKSGQEKMHGAVITRVGNDKTRTFREIAQLGQEFRKLGSRTIGARTKAQVGILFDWNNWWAMEGCSGPTRDKDYLEEVHRAYRPFYKRNVPVDFVKYSDSLDQYQIIAAPALYMINEELCGRIAAFVRNGGTFITGYLSGYADENDCCRFGAYPGLLRDITGIWVEETDALYPEEQNGIVEPGCKNGEEYKAGYLCDLIHMETARPLMEYSRDFYQGMPAVTVNQYGKGRAYYIATRAEEKYLDSLTGRILEEQGVKPAFSKKGEIEIDCRERDDQKIWFLINYGMKDGEVDLGQRVYEDILHPGKTMTGTITISAGDVMVLS